MQRGLDVSGGVAAEIAARWAGAGRRYRVAIVGCGRIARQHAAALTAHPGAELVALCDADPEGLAVFGEAYGVPEDGRFSDYADLFDAVRPDTVHVCTWPDTHAAVTRAAAARGIHVYCEKPMALDLHQADGMIEACREAGVVLGINHHRRGDARFLRAKELIESGAIGQLRLLKGDHGGGGRRLMSMSTHLYDLFRALAGDARWVFGHVMAGGQEATAADVYDIPHEGLAAGDEVTAQFGLAGGAYAYHDGCGHVDVEIAGTHGRMVFHEGAARKPWPFGAARAAWARYPDGDFGRGAGGGVAEWRPLDGMMQEELERPQHAFRRMIDRFLRAVDGRVSRTSTSEEEPLCTGADGRASLEMALGVYAAHYSGGRIDLPLTPSD
ncbi:MAG: Gfo/Idh/MocA family oxidoreductase, partial [Chloroflexota bacterium]|nr:Gfo/Idh/MocA family oxidoreductase [Chloroflexota bacterium]